MKQYIYVLLALLCISFTSCKETDDFFANIEQDRDDDTITGDDYVYHLPVIFHVLYQNKDAKDSLGNPIQYIPSERLKEILNNVNDLYAAKYGQSKDSLSENIHIQFELATENENGETLLTPGVDYIHTNETYPIDCNAFMKQRKKKNKIIWDPNEYINVMVYNFKKTNTKTTTLGISHMPYQADGYPKIEGLANGKSSKISKTRLSYEYCVSLNSLFAYSESSRYTDHLQETPKNTYTPTDVNVTLAHELGHYLGLFHVFCEEEGDDGREAANKEDDTDYCTDTPSYNKLEYDKWLSSYIKEHKNDSVISLKDLIVRNNKEKQWNSDNMMDYAYTLGFRFTPEQRNRIRQVLYYSPLMPGPKKNRSTNYQTRSTTQNDQPDMDLPISVIEDKITANSTRNKIKE